MKRKDGGARSDYDQELDDLILNLLFKKVMNADRIRKKLNNDYGRKLGWPTIKRHLDNLLEQKKIRIAYETEEGKRKIRLYNIIVE